jgi:hypothetical protein
VVVADDANDDHDVTEEYEDTSSNYMEPVRSSEKVTFIRISGAVPQPI